MKNTASWLLAASLTLPGTATSAENIGSGVQVNLFQTQLQAMETLQISPQKCNNFRVYFPKRSPDWIRTEEFNKILAQIGSQKCGPKKTIGDVYVFLPTDPSDGSVTVKFDIYDDGSGNADSPKWKMIYNPETHKIEYSRLPE